MAESLRARRRAAGLTQKQLADHSGVSLRTIIRVESGRAHFNESTRILLVRTLDELGGDVEAVA